MRCFIAVFDQAHLAADGSYWTWRHPDVPLRALDAFYYECAAKHLPESADPISGDGLRGGCASVGDEWVCWYRFVDGGRDKFGRPGRHVLLAAFVERCNHDHRDWSGLLDSPQLKQLALVARTACPVPAPGELEIHFDPPAVKRSAAAEQLRHTRHARLDAANGLEIVAAVCGTMPPGQEFDCSVVRENGAVQVHLLLREARVPQPSEAPESHIRRLPAVSSQSQVRQIRFIQRFNEAIARRAESALARASWQAVALVIAFLAGIALGTLLGWQLRGSFRNSTAAQRRQLDQRSAKTPVLHRENDTGNRVGRSQGYGEERRNQLTLLEDAIRKQ